MIGEIPQLDACLERIAEIRGRFGMAPQRAPSFDEALGRCASPASRKIDPAWQQSIADSALQNEIEPALIKAVMHAESAFNPRAVSSRGAQGLMQLMPGTANSLGVENPFDPLQNIFGGSKYLRQMLDTFNGDLSLALGAYNAGPAAVKRYGGIPPYPETQAYVDNVLRLLEAYRAQEADSDAY